MPALLAERISSRGLNGTAGVELLRSAPEDMVQTLAGVEARQ
jgi:hypothetical protein